MLTDIFYYIEYMVYKLDNIVNKFLELFWCKTQQYSFIIIERFLHINCLEHKGVKYMLLTHGKRV